MRYPCSDGVDRDDAIDEYIELDSQITALVVAKTEIENQLESKRRRLMRIHFDKLGLIGACAAGKEKKRRLSIPVVGRES